MTKLVGSQSDRDRSKRDFLLGRIDRCELYKRYHCGNIKNLIKIKPLVGKWIEDYMNGDSIYQLRKKFKMEHRQVKDLERILIPEDLRR